MVWSNSVPFPSQFVDVDQYVESMLCFITSSQLFHHLCGGVHILEFLTQEPDLYDTLFPEEWRQFLDCHDMPQILDLLLREDLGSFEELIPCAEGTCNNLEWRNGPIPPASLLEYITKIRQHDLERLLPQHDRPASSGSSTLARHVAVGMNAKKTHEVSNLAKYVDILSSELSSKYSCQISHFVDFGSGQNYLGRALACPPYEKKVVALESKPLNIDGARGMDITAKLAKKEAIMRNKKQHRSELYGKHYTEKTAKNASDKQSAPSRDGMPSPASGSCSIGQQSNILYIETMICDGNLSSILAQMNQDSSPSKPNPSIFQPPNLMVISLHSCGNLLHHGLRSITLNPSVRAVALVGCCYNLLTERLPPLQGSPSSKLRVPNARLTGTSSTCDSHGFPMSDRFLKYKHANGEGVRFNITARMMAVQAPRNWTQADCNSFFMRHFYRALFQRILLDKGVIDKPVEKTHPEDINNDIQNPGSNESGKRKEQKEPIILGSLRKPAYASFLTYVRAAIAKLSTSPSHSAAVEQHLANLLDEDILIYEKKYAHKKKELSIVWSLMAFSAQVVESAIVVDRWCWLREQESVKEAWVENVFDYGISPRNLVVVGVKG
ncbi:MAG: hypothetical protein Q9199_001768 [Rusavskia elegans]